MKPLVSVCIPTFNGSAYVEESIQSVLGQTYAHLELIVCDDDSTDSTWPAISSIMDERIRATRNSERLGLVGNWNRCLELAKGEFVTVFHQDDVMEPENLELKVDALLRHPGVGFVYSDIVQIDSSGRFVGGHWTEQPTESGAISGSQFCAMIARSLNPVSCPSVLTRAECYAAVGPFDGRFPFAVDLEMWLRLSRSFGIYFIATPLIRQRKHAGQETSRFSGTGRDYLDVLHVFDSVFAASLESPHRKCGADAYQSLRRNAVAMARWKLRLGKIKPCLMYFWVALRSTWRERRLRSDSAYSS